MARFLIEVEVDESYIENGEGVFEDDGEEIEETESKSAEQWLEEEMGWVAQSGIRMINHTELGDTGKGYITAEQLIDLLKKKVSEREKADKKCKEVDGKIDYPFYSARRTALYAEVSLLEDIISKEFPDEYEALIKEQMKKKEK